MFQSVSDQQLVSHIILLLLQYLFSCVDNSHNIGFFQSNEMESGLVAISNRYCRYFFLLFFICGVIIVNNLVVAVVLDFFIQELDAEEDKEERESRCGFKKLQSDGTEIMFDGEKSPQAKIPRKYVANIRRGFTDQQQKKLLGKLIP